MVPTPRFPAPGLSVYARTSALAAEHRAINLGQGAPDFDGPDVLRQQAAAAMAAGSNQYAPSQGVPALRDAIAAVSGRVHGLAYDAEHEVTVTAGASEALAAVFLALLSPGDEVVGFEPFYDYYPTYARMAGGRFVPVPLVDMGTGFAVDLEQVRRALTPRTRVLLLTQPHNPTGKVFSQDELGALARLCQEADLTIVSDEVYEHLTYDGVVHRSIATLPGMRERTIVISSASKTFSITGWRVGWALAPERLTGPLRAAHMHLAFCAATPLQAAVAEALQWALRGDYFGQLRAAYARKRALLVDALRQAGMSLRVPQGAYFVLARTEGGELGEAQALCDWMARHVGVAPLPMDTFFSDPARASSYVRFAFCKRDEVLVEAASRLAALRPQQWRAARAAHRAG